MNLFFSNYEFVLIVVLLYKFEILFEFLKMSDEKKVTLNELQDKCDSYQLKWKGKISLNGKVDFK